MSHFRKVTVALGLAAALMSTDASAGDADICNKVRLADIAGWADLQAVNAISTIVVQALGYSAESLQVSVPVAMSSLKNKDLDLFLDNWMPSMTNDIKDYLAEGSIEQISVNLTGAGYGIAVPNYMADAGVKSLTDLAKPEVKEKLDGKIYGIEAGNDGNRIILDMIKEPNSPIAGYDLVESSEVGMLTEAEAAIKAGRWIVFLGWTPHPVMGSMKITYLDGMGDSGFGSATVYTITRKDYLKECPNVGTFFKNLKFNLAMEDEMMDSILKGGDPTAVATEWLRKNPGSVEAWLKGVTTLNGGDALKAVNEALAN